MRFCMITTFFGAESFGAEAVYVERLCDALIRRGHEVHVIHDRDSFSLQRGLSSPRPFRPQELLHTHAMESRMRSLSALWTKLTAGPGPKWPFVRNVLKQHDFDVVHFHNIRHLGGTALIAHVRRTTKARLLMTAHNHALLGGNGRRGLARLDALIFPSAFERAAHETRGIGHERTACLPYFLPDEWLPGSIDTPPSTIIWRNPYFLVNCRVTRESGVHTLLPVLRKLPTCDVQIAGDGPYMPDLKRLSTGMANVKFLGVQSSYGMQRLYANTAALLVPTLEDVSFDYPSIEAFGRGRPVIARDIGGLREIVEAGGGLLYKTDEELESALRTVGANIRLRRQMGESGRRAARELWSEEKHIRAYLELIATLQSVKDVTASRGGLSTRG